MAKIENQTTLYKQNMEAIQSKLTSCGFSDHIPAWAIPDAIDAVLGLHEAFVVSKNDTLYTLEQINKLTAKQINAAIPSVRGILLCAEGHRFLIAPTDTYLLDENGNEVFQHYWGGFGFDTSMPNATNMHGVLEQAGKTAATSDFDGLWKSQIMKTDLEDAEVLTPSSGNADETVMQKGSAAIRAALAYEANTKISGGDEGWYIPAAGELCLIYRHLTAIHALMDAFNNRSGIGMFERISNAYYWSSSESSAGNAWYVYFSSGYLGHGYKWQLFRVRPVAVFQ